MIKTEPAYCADCQRPEMCLRYARCTSLQRPEDEKHPKPPETKTPVADAIQIGGDHYKSFGNFQPWTVFEHWYPTEEFLAYLMMSAIAYLPRERMKGGVQDVEKAIHTLQKWVEVRKANPVKNQ